MISNWKRIRRQPFRATLYQRKVVRPASTPGTPSTRSKQVIAFHPTLPAATAPPPPQPRHHRPTPPAGSPDDRRSLSTSAARNVSVQATEVARPLPPSPPPARSPPDS